MDPDGLDVLCVDPDPAALESTAAAIDAASDMRAEPVDSAGRRWRRSKTTT